MRDAIKLKKITLLCNPNCTGKNADSLEIPVIILFNSCTVMLVFDEKRPQRFQSCCLNKRCCWHGAGLPDVSFGRQWGLSAVKHMIYLMYDREALRRSSITIHWCCAQVWKNYISQFLKRKLTRTEILKDYKCIIVYLPVYMRYVCVGQHQERKDEHGFVSRSFTRKYT